MTQPPSARLPGTLQQLELPLLQEPKAFVPQCQGCPGRLEAGRLPLPGGTQAQPHCPEDFQQQNGTDSSRLSPPYPPFTKPIPVKPGFFKLLGLSDRVSP